MKSFLLVSDIHACTIDPTSPAAPSYVSTAAKPGWIDPLDDLERLLKQEALKPDYLLCPGDITNKSNPDALTYAWNRLHQIADGFDCRFVATVGNHDVDSRYQGNKFDPRGYLMSLKPALPVEDRGRFLEFWAENFTIISGDDCTLAIVNTAAYHGGGADASQEIEHGRISDITLGRLEKAIKDLPETSVNLLLCHHHPIKGEPSDETLVGQTRGGERLVAILEQTNRAWVIVHGHKHIPDLFYGHGGANSPVILACASFSAQINADAQNKNPNQVHYLVCDPQGAASGGLTSAGTIRSWTWQPGNGWQRSRGTAGLPHAVGFGFRGNVKLLADAVETMLSSRPTPVAPWHDAVTAVPSLMHLIPSDLQMLLKNFESRGLDVLTERDGSFAQIGRNP